MIASHDTYYSEFREYLKDLKVKTVYKKMYPTDDLASLINSRITFKELFHKMTDGVSFYNIVVVDSIIRERIFKILADIYDVQYDVIYNLELNAKM
jgi:hypothetical protein